MDTTLTFLDLAGSIALLLWGVQMVQTGIQRAFGPNLRRFLGAALGNRFKAFLAGLGVTAILQSSTATGLMVSSFAAGGFIDLISGLAVMLGANVGTTLIVQLLSFDVARVAPLFVLVGVMMFRRGTITRTRDLGRVGIGLGLMLIALSQLLGILTPYEDVPSLRLLLGMIATTPVVAVLVSAALTWAAQVFQCRGHPADHVLRRQGRHPAMPPLPWSGRQSGRRSIRCWRASAAATPRPGGCRSTPWPTGLIGCIVALALLDQIGPALMALEPAASRAVADFHTAFNLLLALIFFPVLGRFRGC